MISLRWTQDYLKNKITASNKFEDNYDSDNKVCAVVRKWKIFDENFQLNTETENSSIFRNAIRIPPEIDDEKAILDFLDSN